MKGSVTSSSTSGITAVKYSFQSGVIISPTAFSSNGNNDVMQMIMKTNNFALLELNIVY